MAVYPTKAGEVDLPDNYTPQEVKAAIALFERQEGAPRNQYTDAGEMGAATDTRTGKPLRERDVQSSSPVGRGMVRAGLETGGSIGGGLLGGVAAPFLGPAAPVAPIAGEAVGYAAGSEAADYLLDEDTGSASRKLGEGLLFSVVPRAVGAGMEKMGRGAVRRALKIPPTQTSRKSAEAAVDTIIDQNLRVGVGGMEKGKVIVEAVENELNGILTNAKSEVDVWKLVDAVDNLKPRFAYGSDPAEANMILDSVKDRIIAHPLASKGKIPLQDAQKMKKALYQELDSFYKNARALEPAKAISSNVESVGKAGWAEALREEIMSAPEVVATDAAKKLKLEADVLNATRWIKRRANVAENMDPITFNDVLLGGMIREGIPAAVAIRALRSPAVLSQIGIWSSRGSKPVAKQGGKALIATKGLLSAGEVPLKEEEY